MTDKAESQRMRGYGGFPNDTETQPCATCGGVGKHHLGCWRVDDRGDLLPIKERLVEWAHSSACKGQGFGGHRWGRLDYTLLEAASGKAADDKAIDALIQELDVRAERIQYLEQQLRDADSALTQAEDQGRWTMEQ